MSATFIAVVILMVLLIGFVMVILQSLAGAAGVRIRADMVKLLESYDKVIESKTRELNRLQTELERLHTPPAAAMPAEGQNQGGTQTAQAPIPRAASYRSGTLSGSYGAIQSSFHLSCEECEALARQVAEDSAAQRRRGEAAQRLRGALSFDTVFSLTQLPGDEQLEVLDTTLDDEGWTLLRDYCAERDDRPFDAGRFYHWLDELAELEGGDLLMRGRAAGAPSGEASGICEGVQIVAGGKLYDFSIQEREIG